jgi:uncharacterized protein
MKSFFLHYILLLLLPVMGFTQSTSLKTFPLSSVRLLNSPFKQAQETDMKYVLAHDPDRLLSPFLREAGIQPKAPTYGNWEGTGLDGHTGGHYLSALSNLYAATGNAAVLHRLNYMINWLDQCQQKNGNGYVGGIPNSKALWQEIAAGKIEADAFSLNKRWVPWHNIHKLYAGLVDACRVAGNQKAKDILVKLSDWCLQLTAGLSDEQMQQILRSAIMKEKS